MNDQLEAAAMAIREGELVVYPTETVYGLGGDALDPGAIERVYEVKGRDRSDPLSMAVPSIEAARDYIESSAVVTSFMEAFLPGPITVIAEKTDRVPDVLTSGRNRVGLRIPDHDLALDLLNRVSPITATSANVSGSESVTSVEELSPRIRDGVATVIDGGETPGLESTVVDPGLGTIHRRGAKADEVADWLRVHDR